MIARASIWIAELVRLERDYWALAAYALAGLVLYRLARCAFRR